MKIELLQSKDLSLTAALQVESWSDIVASFRAIVEAEHCFPYKLHAHGEILGLGAYILHDEVAWLANIIVRQTFRNKGLGKKITKHLIEVVQAKGCKTIYLSATKMGAHVYEKIGFQTETNYVFFKDLDLRQESLLNENIIPFDSKFYEDILQLDQKISGENRLETLKPYLKSGSIYLDKNQVGGFYLPELRDGLIIANTREAGLGLMKLRFKSKSDAVFPVDNMCAMHFMKERNLEPWKIEKRMYFGDKRKVLLKNQYNRIAGKLG